MRALATWCVRHRRLVVLFWVAAVPYVTNCVSPYSPAGAAQVSKDQTVAFATVTFDRQAQNISTGVAQQLVNAVRSADGPSLQAAVEGAVAESANKPSLGGVGFGAILAGIVLLLVRSEA